MLSAMSRPRKSVNIQSIAREAGVSISTVSRVLNNRTEVSDEVRRKVRCTLEHNSFVAAPIRSRRLNVGVVLPMDADFRDALGGYESLALGGIASKLLENEIEATLIFHCEGNGVSLIDKLRARACHSVILLNSDKLLGCAKELASSGISVTLLNGQWNLSNVGSIDCDCFDAGLKLGRHLASLGHRNISLLQNLPLKNHIDRRDGLRQTLAEAFGKSGFKLVEFAFIKMEQVFESGFLQAERALRENPEATAMVGINDHMAYGAIGACVKAKLRIPDDIAVAGFDDYPLSASYNPPLTTVRQPILEMSRLAAEYALKGIGSASTEPPPQIVMPVELIVRESTSNFTAGKSRSGKDSWKYGERDNVGLPGEISRLSGSFSGGDNSLRPNNCESTVKEIAR